MTWTRLAVWNQVVERLDRLRAIRLQRHAVRTGGRWRADLLSQRFCGRQHADARRFRLWGWCAYQLVASHFHARGIPRFVNDSPTYDLPVFNGLDRITHRAEPSVGFGYRF